MTLSLDDLAHVTGGQSADPTAGLKRAAEQKAGKNSLDLYGYQTTTTNGVGAEYRRRLTTTCRCSRAATSARRTPRTTTA